VAAPWASFFGLNLGHAARFNVRFHCGKVFCRQVATKTCHDDTKVHAIGMNAIRSQPMLELDGEQYICGFCLTVSLPFLGLAIEKRGTFEIDPAPLVASRREVDDARGRRRRSRRA
jgi:hypothetical protein